MCIFLIFLPSSSFFFLFLLNSDCDVKIIRSDAVVLVAKATVFLSFFQSLHPIFSFFFSFLFSSLLIVSLGDYYYYHFLFYHSLSFFFFFCSFIMLVFPLLLSLSHPFFHQELFVDYLAKEAYELTKHHKRKTIQHDDVGTS